MTQTAIVVGAAGIAELARVVPGPYREIGGDFTGAVATGAPTVKRCISWSPVNGAGFRSCTRIQNPRQNRTLQVVTVTLNRGGMDNIQLAAIWTSRARAALAASAPSVPAIAVALRGLPTTYSLTAWRTSP